MRISDWSSDVCSSDLHAVGEAHGIAKLRERGAEQRDAVVARNIVERAFGSARQPVLRVGAEAGLGPLDLGGGVHGGCPRLAGCRREIIRLLTLMQVTPCRTTESIHRKFNSPAESLRASSAVPPP